MEEKKLTDEVVVAKNAITDEEIAKAILQSIEYSKTITYFDEWGNCKSIFMTDILDLIYRLKKENEELKSPKFASWKLKFFNLKEEFDKELAEHEEFTKKANAEIERLTKLAELRLRDNQDTCKLLAEKEKQVDELKEERENMQAVIFGLEDAIDREKKWGKVQRKQVRRDTAREALEAFICNVVNARLVGTNYDLYYELLEVKDDLLKDKYGVEVE